MEIRDAQPEDYESLIAQVDEWWGGRRMRSMLPRLFFEHFADTSLVAVDSGRVIGFLCGFLSQSKANESYIHFVGVDPMYRGRGIGRRLYERFLAVAERHGRDTIRCVTSPVNKASIAFHTRMGFEIERGNGVVDGVQVDKDHDGPGEDRVLFAKKI